MTATKHVIDKAETMSVSLSLDERLHFRDRLREARYAALADAEAFQQMCFAIEALGKRLHPKGNGLGARQNAMQQLSNQSKLLPKPGDGVRAIKPFHVLFAALKEARNDAMHTGAYARHVAADAVTLCLVLEDALMVENKSTEAVRRLTVGDFMVSTPVVVQPWQTVEQARQLMLSNSFSYLPIALKGKWWLISDIAIAQYLRPHWQDADRLMKKLADAKKDGLKLTRNSPVGSATEVTKLLNQPKKPGLWLVSDEKGSEGDRLIGVLSPFELM